MEHTKWHPEDTLKDQLDFLEEFARAWRMLVGSEAPSMGQLNRWHQLHHPLRMLATLSRVSAKAERMAEANKEFSADHQVKFFSSVANILKTEEQEQENCAERSEDTMDAQTIENTKNTETPSTPQPFKKTPFGYIGTPKTAEAVATDSKTGALTPKREN